VGNCVHFIVVHDGGANADRSGPLAHLHLLESAVGLFLEHRFTPVVGDVDEGRLKLHQGVEIFVYGINGLAFQGREDLKGNKGIF